MTRHTEGTLTVLIGNVRRGDTGVYIGRKVAGREGSPLGNPFRLTGTESVGDTLERYRTWLRAEYAKHAEAYTELHRLRDVLLEEGVVTLTCWCSPKPCHGDILAECLLKLAAAV
ncbi:DUF4326 domain-containing protein [Candidatus Poribacteria bacterium]|jgi:hypothetical protein|nr:DUF4326 domain-containing protein [Candidatus Poribacteria bacterium]